jgi:hypothetical protein
MARQQSHLVPMASPTGSRLYRLRTRTRRPAQYTGNASQPQRRMSDVSMARSTGWGALSVSPPMNPLDALKDLVRVAANWCPVCHGYGSVRGNTTTKCPNCFTLLLRAHDAITALERGSHPRSAPQ